MKEYIKKESRILVNLSHAINFSVRGVLYRINKEKKKHDFKRNLLHMILICNQMVILLKLGNNFIISLVNIP